jgi:hypothetical protein
MRKQPDHRRRRCRLAPLAAAALLLGAYPISAPSAAVPCSAFARNNYGGWKVLAPVMLDLHGMLLAPTVGTTFAVGARMHGVEMAEVLEQQCGTVTR